MWWDALKLCASETSKFFGGSKWALGALFSPWLLFAIRIVGSGGGTISQDLVSWGMQSAALTAVIFVVVLFINLFRAPLLIAKRLHSEITQLKTKLAENESNERLATRLEILSAKLLDIWKRRYDRDTETKKSAFSADANQAFMDIGAMNQELARRGFLSTDVTGKMRDIGFFSNLYHFIAAHLQSNGAEATQKAVVDFLAVQKPGTDVGTNGESHSAS